MPNQFVVPQFIDVEDKIIGPINVRQFIIMIIGAALIVGAYQILYKLANLATPFFFTSFGITVFVVLFAFIRVNGRAFHHFLLNLLQALKNPRMRIWDNGVGERIQYRREPPPPPPVPTKQPLIQTKLAQLSLLVDTGGAYHEDEELLYWGQSLKRKPEPPLDDELK